MQSKEHVCDMLRTFVRQRPGLDFRNYCSGWNDENGRKAYNTEVRTIGRHLRDAMALLAVVESSSVTVEGILDAARSAFSGRLTIGDEGINYCTGQYWPTEYRAAVCAVLTQALWHHWREDGDTGDTMRARFVRRFGRGLAGRWAK